MTTHPSDTAKQLLQKTDEELYAQIAEHLGAASAIPLPTASQLAGLGKRWFEAKRSELADIVCRNDRIKALAAQNLRTHELVVSVCGVLDISIHILGGVPPVTVAALLVRQGLHHICAQIWRAPNTE